MMVFQQVHLDNVHGRLKKYIKETSRFHERNRLVFLFTNYFIF